MQELGNQPQRDVPLTSHKRRIQSVLLSRLAHADVFEVGSQPRFLFVLFGGSGIDEEEYGERSTTVIPIFQKVLDGVARDNIALVMVHVTAPYDVPFNRFTSDPGSAAKWNQHVLTELLEPWSTLPYFVAGFSGGVALALHGLQAEPRCFGAAGFGADALPRGFTCPSHWKERLRLCVAPRDAVCTDAANQMVMDSLIHRRQAEQLRLRAGGHRLADYATDDGLGDVIRWAHRIAPEL